MGGTEAFRPGKPVVKEEDRILRGDGGFSSASFSLLPRVYHRRAAEAEEVCRCEVLLKKAGGGLSK